MSPTFMAWLFGGIGVGVAWSLVRAVNSGRISSETATYQADGQPGLYLGTLIGHVVILILCLAEVGHGLGWGPDPFQQIKAWLGPFG